MATSRAFKKFFAELDSDKIKANALRRRQATLGFMVYKRRRPGEGKATLAARHSIEPRTTRFSKDFEAMSLVEDHWRALTYAREYERIDREFPIKRDGGVQDGSNAEERNLIEKRRLTPALTNSLSRHVSHYPVVRTAMENLLHNAVCRNKLEESLVASFLDKQPTLHRLMKKVTEPVPELYGPLHAFVGLPVEKSWLMARGQTMGGLSFGKPGKFDENDESLPESLGPSVRYPTLASFAMGSVSSCSHLPKRRETASGSLSDKAGSFYDKVYSHSLAVLERTKGWDTGGKIEAANKLRESLDSLSRTHQLRSKLDVALSSPLKNSGSYLTSTEYKALRGDKKGSDASAYQARSRALSPSVVGTPFRLRFNWYRDFLHGPVHRSPFAKVSFEKRMKDRIIKFKALLSKRKTAQAK